MKYISTSLLHTAWTEDEKISLDEALAFSEEYAGDNYVKEVAAFLFQLLKTDYIIIAGASSPTDKILKSAILLERGKIISNQLYKVEGTPFGLVMGNDLCYYPFGTKSIFPEDKMLQDLNIESFLGIPLYNERDENLGVLALMHSSIIERGGYVEALLNAVSPRLERELLYFADFQKVVKPDQAK